MKKIIITVLLTILIFGGSLYYYLTKQQTKYTLSSAETYNYNNEEIARDIHITADGVILKNVILNADLYIDESVGDGHIELYNVEVNGTVYVNGGGIETIFIQNGMILKLIGYVDARIEAVEDTIIEEVQVKSPGMILENNDTAKEAFPNVQISIENPEESDDPVILDGAFDTVEVNAGNNVELAEYSKFRYMPLISCSKTECPENYKTKVKVNKNVTVEEMEIENPFEIENEGTIEKITYAENISPNGEKITAPDDADYIPQILNNISIDISSSGNYILYYQTNAPGTIYYVIQPYFETTKYPSIDEIIEKDGLQNGDVESQLCQEGNMCMFVVSAKSIDVKESYKVYTGSGYMGDFHGQRPEADTDVPFDSIIWSVFEDESGNYSKITKTIAK